jgi:hypothetical protein
VGGHALVSNFDYGWPFPQVDDNGGALVPRVVVTGDVASCQVCTRYARTVKSDANSRGNTGYLIPRTQNCRAISLAHCHKKILLVTRRMPPRTAVKTYCTRSSNSAGVGAYADLIILRSALSL